MDRNIENIEIAESNVEVTSIVSKKKVVKYYVGLPTTIVHDGYPYTHKKVFVKEDSGLYWCKHSSSCKCLAKIKIILPSGSVYVIDDSHTEKCVAKLFKQV